MRSQKIQLFAIVIGIEQGAALGGAGLMVEAKRRALILDIDRAGAHAREEAVALTARVHAGAGKIPS